MDHNTAMLLALRGQIEPFAGQWSFLDTWNGVKCNPQGTLAHAERKQKCTFFTKQSFSASGSHSIEFRIEAATTDQPIRVVVGIVAVAADLLNCAKFSPGQTGLEKSVGLVFTQGQRQVLCGGGLVGGPVGGGASTVQVTVEAGTVSFVVDGRPHAATVSGLQGRWLFGVALCGATGQRVTIVAGSGQANATAIEHANCVGHKVTLESDIAIARALRGTGLSAPDTLQGGEEGTIRQYNALTDTYKVSVGVSSFWTTRDCFVLGLPEEAHTGALECEELPSIDNGPELLSALRLLSDTGACGHEDEAPEPEIPLEPGLASVQQYLAVRGASYEVISGRLLFYANGHPCICAQQSGIVYFYVMRADWIPPSRVPEASLILHKVHQNFLLGRLEVDADGDVGVHVGTYAGERALPEKTIDRCIRALDQSIDAVLPKLAPLKERAPNETFCYMCGVQVARPQWLDISDAACAQYGDFRHGDRVRDPSSGYMATTIGVREGQIWFHVDGARGAGLYEDATLRRLKKIGHQEVQALL